MSGRERGRARGRRVHPPRGQDAVLSFAHGSVDPARHSISYVPETRPEHIDQSVASGSHALSEEEDFEIDIDELTANSPDADPVNINQPVDDDNSAAAAGHRVRDQEAHCWGLDPNERYTLTIDPIGRFTYLQFFLNNYFILLYNH